MITKEKFYSIKEKYGRVASWAIWAHEDEEPKKKETSAFCENCGNTLNPKAKFCGSCGTPRA